jgi:hypothetical protein
MKMQGFSEAQEAQQPQSRHTTPAQKPAHKKPASRQASEAATIKPCLKVRLHRS